VQARGERLPPGKFSPFGKGIASVPERIGFAEMVNGWLTASRSVQFTVWNTGDRIIVNFGDRPFDPQGKEPLQGRSFRVERTETR
jgi:hypothetical protein